MIESFEIQSTFNVIKGVITYPKSAKGIFPCVILSHGLISSKESTKYIEIADILAKEGILSIRFDYHGCGESGGRIEETTLTKRLENLERIFEFALSHSSVDKGKIGILGSSFGGVTAILKASKDQRVKAIVIFSTPYALRNASNEISGVTFQDSFFTDFSTYNVLEAAKSVSYCLVVHGENDEIVPSEHAKAIYRRLKPPKKVKIIENADHIFSDPSHRRAAIEMAVSWFKRYLLRPTSYSRP